jgi:hypothetical protein
MFALAMLSSTLAAAAGCPTNLSFTVGGATNLDLGWLGLAHYTSLPGWSMRLGVDNCQGSTAGSCGECAISGILPAADGRNQRCSNDTSISCGDDAPCATGGGHCAIYAAPAMTFDISSVTSCLLNEIAPPVTGTVAVELGEVALTLPVRATLYYVPCPVCLDDPVENDGIAGGTCQAGTRANQPCDANATSPVPGFGSTSFDCPLEEEDEIGSLAIPTQPLSFSTGTQTKTLTAANPFCSGDLSHRCHCDTCNNAAATPCSTNADCVAVGATVCGGKRCIAGSNVGNPCTASSECPGGLCGRPGELPKPNPCLDDTAVPPDGHVCTDTAPVDGEGECLDGPFYSHCAGIERHKGCGVDGDCPVTHQCITEHASCFPGDGEIGSSVLTSGSATARSGDVSDPTVLSALWCARLSTSNVFNGYAAVPGLARLTLNGSLTYADDAVPTPTRTATPSAATPTPTPTVTPALCPPVPATCRGSTQSGTSTIALFDKSPDDKDRLQWKWASGAATAKSDFGDPLSTDDYILCLYDGSGVRATVMVPSGGICDGKPCWKDQKKGFSYKRKTPTAGGITQVQLVAGVDGKAKIAVKGKGTALPDVPLASLASPVTLQIRSSNAGICFGSTFSFPPAVKSTAEQFKDKGD